MIKGDRSAAEYGAGFFLIAFQYLFPSRFLVRIVGVFKDTVNDFERSLSEREFALASLCSIQHLICFQMPKLADGGESSG